MNENWEMIQQLVNQIEDDLAEDVNVLSLSKASGLSPWHFQRLFKSLIGDSLGNYIRGRRLTKAAQLLLDTRLGILDIAVEVGFGSHEAFSRSFKSVFQQSPKVFRDKRPQVRLNKKPLLTESLFDHLTQDIQLEPMILNRPVQTLVGFETQIPSPFVSDASYCHQIYESWMQLIQRQAEIPHRIETIYYGLTISPSGNFTELELGFLAGAPVTQLETVPDGMVSYPLPEQQIAVFEVSDVAADTVNKTIDYIYGFWLPNSSYTRGFGDDYEYFEDITTMEDFGRKSKYIIPVVPKSPSN